MRASPHKLLLRETFHIARGSADEETVVVAELEHDGITGYGEGAPVDYWGETAASISPALEDEGAALLGDDPLATEAIAAAWRPGRAAGREDGARRARSTTGWASAAGCPVWQLLGVEGATPPTSYTIGIDTVEGTADKTRRAVGYEVLKVKVGGADDLARLHAVRAETDARMRIDGNEGWTLETARELMPELVAMGLEFVEQPFPADDLEAYRALASCRAAAGDHRRGLQDLARVAPIAAYADGINIKLSKCGGIREALRMIHAARALGLKVMLGCMIESELGIAQAAQLAPLVDYIDLDGHLLISRAVRGPRLRGRAARAVAAPGPGRGADRWLIASPSSPTASSTTPTRRPPTGSCATATRDVVAVVDSEPAGSTADEVVPYARRPVPIVATVEEAEERGATCS